MKTKPYISDSKTSTATRVKPSGVSKKLTAKVSTSDTSEPTKGRGFFSQILWPSKRLKSEKIELVIPPGCNQARDATLCGPLVVDALKNYVHFLNGLCEQNPEEAILCKDAVLFLKAYLRANGCAKVLKL
jgi:hypothetical protein